MDLLKANQEIQDMIIVAQLNNREKSIFVNKVQKKLRENNVSLDYFYFSC